MDVRKIEEALNAEQKKFQTAYAWLENHMPPKFFEELSSEQVALIAHNFISLELQDYFSEIKLKTLAIVLCLETPDADLEVLKHYRLFCIRGYQAFVSNVEIPGTKKRLRVAILNFKEHIPNPLEKIEKILPHASEIFLELKKRGSPLSETAFHALIREINPRFLQSLTKERLLLGLEMYSQARTEDSCQYEVRYNEDWEAKKETPSLQIVLSWRNVPKNNFLYRLAKVIYRHNLQMTRVNATYINSAYAPSNVMLLSLGLHGAHGKAAWEETDIADFLQELSTVKYSEEDPLIDGVFVDRGLISGNMGNFLRTMVYFIHQSLLHKDPNMYSFSHIEEGLCRHPELTVMLCKAFTYRFHPENFSEESFDRLAGEFQDLVSKLDTGNDLNDTRRKNILRTGFSFICNTLKTNFYCKNKTAFSFRVDPKYLSELPYDITAKFPEIPFALFFIKGLHFFGFHIRFKDLSRGGLRTVCPEKLEQYLGERNFVFAECYNLAYTQQKKNKDIPEGGSKGIILLEPREGMDLEATSYQNELEILGESVDSMKQKLSMFHIEHALEFLYESQRAYIESLMTLINCSDDGSLKDPFVKDYYQKPEYIYLGPDENAHNVIIEWIAAYSKKCGYKPGGAFISSKPSVGINHKEYGVTSLGVNVCLEETLRYLNIDPKKQPFTIKITGGPDGDVAGNEILNLLKFYPKTAKLLALTDVSGTIYDPHGLDLECLKELFHASLSIHKYPPEKLHDGGFLLDLKTKRDQTAYSQQSLLWKMQGGKLIQEWLSGHEMNHLFRHNVLKTKSDIFIPCGGRPRTLNESNWEDFLDEHQKPTSRAIIEGANLFLTQEARRALEGLGVLIIKDSSANKGGVICSSFEVLAGLVMSEKDFLLHKKELVKEILKIIENRARDEAKLLLDTHRKTGEYLTDLSEKISLKINHYTYELLDYLETLPLSKHLDDPLIQCLLSYVPPLIREKYREALLKNLPDIHKKAIIACTISQKIIYQRGVNWSPSIVDVLPLIIDLSKSADNQ